MVKHQSFPIPSWVDLPHVWNTSSCMAFHSRHCQNYLPLTSSIFTFTIFLIPGTFHPKRWSISSPRCSSLEILYLEFESPQSRPNWESRSLHPPKRSILPTLVQSGLKDV